jgi:hypothetical protein
MTWEERPADAGAEAERARGRSVSSKGASSERASSEGRRPTRGAGSVLLRALLLAVDTLALGGAWLVMAVVAGKPSTPAAIGVVVFAVGGLWLFRTFGLYKTSVCMLRSVELARLARATVVLALAAIAAQAMLGETSRIEEGALLAAVALLLAGAGRSGYRVWVSGRRRIGDFRRPVVIVGANEEAAELIALIDSHPELGFKIAGVVGNRTEAGRTGLSRRWIGDDHELFDALASVEASGTIVCATALEPARLNTTVQKLLAAGVHVQLSSGLRGVQIQRLRPMPLAYEPLFYVEPVDLGQWQLVTKRVLDVVLSLGVLVVTAPILLVTTVLVRLTSPGPVIFRQERIGLGGKPFTVFKFRTMRAGCSMRAKARCSRQRSTPGSRGSGGTCARRASTSCRSSSTC